MTSYPSLKRWLAAGLTGGLLAIAIIVAGLLNPAVRNTVSADAPSGGKHDWVMYGGTPARNLVNTQVKCLPAEFSPTQNVKWSADLGSKAYGGPIIAGGRVFVGTNNQKPRNPADVKNGKPLDLGVLMAFNENNGKFLWQNAFPKLAAGRVNDWPLEGLCSSPVVEGDKLYFVSNRCEVVCSDATTGKDVWKLDMIKELNVFPHNLAVCSPLLVGNDLWIVTSNGVDEDHINVPAPKAPSFIKIDKTNGKVHWQDNEPTVNLTNPNLDKGGNKENFFKKLVNRGELIQHGQWSNAAYGIVGGQAQVVFPGGDGWIRAFDTAGKLLWKFDCNPKDSEYELAGKGTRNDFIATPVIYKDRVYIGVGQDPEHETGVGHLWCIDMSKRGDVSPELVTDNSVWPPKTQKNPNSAAVWHFGGQADAETRKKTQRNFNFGRTMSTCSLHEGLCYVAELAGWIHCLDADTGKLYWQHDTESPTWCSTYCVDNKVYLGTDAKEVFVFEHGKQKKLLAQNDMEGPVRATPVAANGVLYVMTSNKLYAFEQKK
jgi:outer membrane protein assembly factor BamB